MFSEQLEHFKDNIKEQNRIAEEIMARELTRQTQSWNEFAKLGILSIFHLPDLETSFFTNRNSFRKRSNLSFDEQIFMKAPNNVEFRMPVAIKNTDRGITLYDPYGSLNISVENKPEYALSEDKIYIMKMIKRFPMYPLQPILEENRNGVELHLKLTKLPLYAEQKDMSDFKYLTEQPKKIMTESEAIDIITSLQNIYRLNHYDVERNNPITIAVNAVEPFLVTYDKKRYCLKIALLTTQLSSNLELS